MLLSLKPHNNIMPKSILTVVVKALMKTGSKRKRKMCEHYDSAYILLEFCGVRGGRAYIPAQELGSQARHLGPTTPNAVQFICPVGWDVTTVHALDRDLCLHETG